MKFFQRLRDLPNPAKTALNHVRQWPDPSPRAYRDQMFLGHYFLLIALAYSADIIFNDVTNWPTAWPVRVVGDFIFTLFLLGFYSDFRLHSHKLCERCARATPLDPQAAVARWRPVLRWLHRERARKVFLAVLVVAIAVKTFWDMGGYRNYADIVTLTAIVAWCGAQRKHGRLQAWCPWCHWGKGGDEEVSPEVPDPAVSR